MGGDVHIKQTRRSTYRPMNTMNGDFLPKLKKPIASEFGQGLKGQNAAHREVLKKQLDLWYRERDIVLGKVSRRQDEVYGTLLQVHKHKKVLQRETWKRHQEESRKQAEEDRLVVRDGRYRGDVSPLRAPRTLDPITEVSLSQTVVSKPEPVHSTQPRTDSTVSKGENGKVKSGDKAQNTDSVRDKTDTSIKSHTTGKGKKPRPQDPPTPQTDGDKASTAAPVREMKAKVLEVRKGGPTEPLVRERSSSQLDLLNKEPSGIKPLPEKLDSFSSINGLVSEPRADDKHEEQAETPTPAPKKKKRKKSDVTKPQRQREPTLPRITEHVSPGGAPTPLNNISPIVDSGPSPRRRSQEGLPRPPLDSLLSDRRRAASEPQVSLIEENKRRAKRKEKRRRDILDKEGFTLYLKNRKGDIVPSDCPWRRKDFNPPSMREKAFQHKMLKAQTHAIDVQMQKLEIFLEKIDAEGRFCFNLQLNMF